MISDSLAVFFHDLFEVELDVLLRASLIFGMSTHHDDGRVFCPRIDGLQPVFNLIGLLGLEQVEHKDVDGPLREEERVCCIVHFLSCKVPAAEIDELLL